MKAKKSKFKTKLRVGDEVIVITGKSKSQKGELLYLSSKSNRVFVKGINLRKKIVKTQENPKGVLVEVESPLAISNVQYYDSKAKKASRLGYEIKEGKKVRVSKASNKEV